MADGNNSPEDPAGIFNEIDPETAAGHNYDQEGNTSDGSDMEATVLGVTYAIGIIKKEFPSWVVGDQAKCASATSAALNAHAEFPEHLLQHSVAVQGANLVNAGFVAVEVPFQEPLGPDEYGPKEFDVLTTPGFTNEFLKFSLSIEGCKFVVEWPHDACIVTAITELLMLDPAAHIGVHLDASTIDKVSKDKAILGTRDTPVKPL